MKSFHITYSITDCVKYISFDGDYCLQNLIVVHSNCYVIHFVIVYYARCLNKSVKMYTPLISLASYYFLTSSAAIDYNTQPNQHIQFFLEQQKRKKSIIWKKPIQCRHCSLPFSNLLTLFRVGEEDKKTPYQVKT